MDKIHICLDLLCEQNYIERKETLKEVFDYTQHTPEFVNLEFCFCHAVYVLNNEFTISILMYIEDVPKEIRYEI